MEIRKLIMGLICVMLVSGCDMFDFEDKCITLSYNQCNYDDPHINGTMLGATVTFYGSVCNYCYDYVVADHEGVYQEKLQCIGGVTEVIEYQKCLPWWKN